jgi:hypothetical protein
MEDKEGKYYMSISNHDPEKIINLELDEDNNTIWILRPSGELVSTTLWQILKSIDDDFKEGEKNGNCFTIDFEDDNIN